MIGGVFSFVNFLYRNLTSRLLVIIGFIVLAILTGTIGVLLWRTMDDMQQTRMLLRHTRKVQFALDNFRANLSDAESRQLRFVLTHNNINVEPFNKFLTATLSEHANLVALTEDNATQQKTLGQIEPRLKEKVQVMEQTVDLTRQGNYPAAEELVKADSGRISMEAIQAGIETMQAQETQLLLKRQDTFQRNFQLNSRLSLALNLICFVFIIALLLLMRRLQQLQSAVTLDALAEMLNYEGGTLTIEEYIRRRHEALMAHGHAQIEAERLLGLLGKIKRGPAETPPS